MKERRRTTRNAVNKRARIVFDRCTPPIDCVVHDLTSEGACIYFAVNFYAPKWFELSFDNFRSRRTCRLAWQHENKLGVAFCYA